MTMPNNELREEVISLISDTKPAVDFATLHGMPYTGRNITQKFLAIVEREKKAFAVEQLENERNNPFSESNVRCAVRLSNADQKHKIEVVHAVTDAVLEVLDRIKQVNDEKTQHDVGMEIQAIKDELTPGGRE